MSDDIRIPAPFPGGRAPTSYRARPARAEWGGRGMKLLAAGLGGVLLLGVGGWATFGRRPASVPVIEADGRPIRVKPENPGGMQVAGAEEMGAGDAGAERMAPAPEAPAPQALLAQMQLGAAPAPAAVPESPVTAPSGAAAQGVGRTASPLPDTPVRSAPPVAARVAAVPAKAPSAAAEPAKAAVAGMMVQVAAVDSEEGAKAEWQRLAKKMPELLADRRPAFQKAERDGHAIWRVRTGGFADTADATGFCVKLRTKGGACTIATF